MAFVQLVYLSFLQIHQYHQIHVKTTETHSQSIKTRLAAIKAFRRKTAYQKTNKDKRNISYHVGCVLQIRELSLMLGGSLNILQTLNSCFSACFLAEHVRILFLLASPFSRTHNSATGFQNKSTCFTIKAVS